MLKLPESLEGLEVANNLALREMYARWREEDRRRLEASLANDFKRVDRESANLRRREEQEYLERTKKEKDIAKERELKIKLLSLQIKQIEEENAAADLAQAAKNAYLDACGR